jgi:8-oxo-dGTP pyrophosphatase MutT (NUDIX family)
LKSKHLLKVTAYITRFKGGQKQLLTMIELGQESFGLQVPGGTVVEGESLEEALLREIYEESELENVRIIKYLGEHKYDLIKLNQVISITRYYYHVSTECDRDDYTVTVRSNDEDNGWMYHYKWLNFGKGESFHLGGELGHYLAKL